MAMGDFDESGLIEWIRSIAKECPNVLRGIGDDSALVQQFAANMDVLYTTDNLIENVHFLPQASPAEIGHKAISRALSDIAAMGGYPRYTLLSISMPSQYSTIDEVIKGFLKTAAQYDVYLIGGDLSRSPSGLYLSVVVIGEVLKGRSILRSNAKVNDQIYVTGHLGGAQKGKHLNFTPRVKEGQWLANHDIPNAMIDISDGLVVDLKRIMRLSSLGADLFEECLPLSKNESTHSALFDGEDYELLFTTQSSEWIDSFKNAFGIEVASIGKMCSGSKLVIKNSEGKIKEVSEDGFKHF